MRDCPTDDASMLDWALWCADLGRETGAFKVFPLHPGLKAPRHKGWQKAAAWDPKSIEMMFSGDDRNCNIGLAIQPGFVAIDADVYKPENARELATAEVEFGRLPDTMEFQTASGGYHLIYSTERVLGNARGTLPKFGDVRGHGGLLAGPGSIFEGNRYRPVLVQAPERLPDWAAARLIEKKLADDTTRTPPDGVQIDDPVNINSYIHWLKRIARPSIAGQGGNNALAQAGAMGHSYALSKAETVNLLLEHFNERCEPPWEEHEVERHGGSGFSSSTSRYGNMARPDLFQPILRPRPTIGGDNGRITARDMLGDPPPREWAIGDDSGDGWVPLDEITLLYGPGGVGKSLLVAQMALAVSRGEPFIGLPARKMPVLFASSEDSPNELWRRFKNLGIRESDKDLVVLARAGMDNFLNHSRRDNVPDDTTFWLELDAELRDMGDGPKMLILDNLAQVFLGEESSNGEVTWWLNQVLRRLCINNNATCILVAHPSESQRKDGSGGSGAVAWVNGVRSRLYFEYPRNHKQKEFIIGPLREFKRTKSNYSAPQAAGEEITVKYTKAGFMRSDRAVPRGEPIQDMFKPIGRPPTVTLTQVLNEVRAVLEYDPPMRYTNTMMAEKLADKLDVSQDTIRTHMLPRLAKDHPKLYRDGRWSGNWT